MKALILSGGKGTRLRPITYTSAKQLVPVANKPILFYALETIAAAGIQDVGMIVGDTESEIRSNVGDGSRWGTTVTYIRQSDPLGLAHAVKVAQPYLQDEPFVMYLGDNLVRDGIGSFVDQFKVGHADALILLAHVHQPDRFGVAELHDGRVIRLQEKPRYPASDLALVGVYLFTERIFEAVNAIEPSSRGELEITDAIQYMLDDGGRVEPHVIEGWWKDTGRLEDMLEANRFVLEGLQPRCSGRVNAGSRIVGSVVIEQEAEIIDSTIRGPAIIGPKARIVNSYVGPYTSVCGGVDIQGSEIEHSIIMANSRILEAGLRIEDSLIGKGVVIRHADGMPRSLRFMLGDHSEVQLV